MSIKRVKISVNKLAEGMFVSGLDRPWSETPFLLQGLYINSATEIRQLKEYCTHVYIDVAHGSAHSASTLHRSKASSADKLKSRSLTKKRMAKKVESAPLKIRRNSYENVKPMKTEVRRARELYSQVYDAIGFAMDQPGSEYQPIPVWEAQCLAGEIVDSVLRSPDAFTNLSRTQKKDEHIFSHAMRAIVWAILFGRHLGLTKSELDALATGVLLKDIGKTRLTMALLRSQKLSEAERRLYEKFVNYGVAILQQIPSVEKRVISIVATHCERIDGSGFPKGLRGVNDIPLLGQIAGIVTYYDEITHPRGRTHPLSPSKAVAKLYEMRGKQFDERLVVEFIRSIGLYPTGTLVELSTGAIAVVVEQNFKRRLKPKVMIVIDENKVVLDAPQFFDLAADERRKQALVDAGKLMPQEIERIEVVHDLEPDAYAVNIDAVQDQYIRGTQESIIKALFKRTRKPVASLSAMIKA